MPSKQSGSFKESNLYIRSSTVFKAVTRSAVSIGPTVFASDASDDPAEANTAVKRNAHVRDLRKRGKNKGKLYTKECGLNKNTKYKKTPENIR